MLEINARRRASVRRQTDAFTADRASTVDLPTGPGGVTGARLDGSVNEALVRGREDIYFRAEYLGSAGTAAGGVDRHYVERLAPGRDAVRGSFAS